ncbi:leucyl/phenylalanyl-tRNA--protein transferase [Burkholderiales bacterium JOSHI_001]|nr:leucyl/phenylalanyl-tRNA--protein transferase [Burkholderiales bacterium JOSHI_001]
MAPAPLPWLDDDSPLPPTHEAQGPDSDTPGLLALGGRVSPARLELAYRQGVFPWYGPGLPVMWWAPDPRMVLPVAEFRISTTFRKTLRRFARTPGCEIRIDSAFADVMQACADAPRQGQAGTWIVPEMLRAYRDWHAQGRVHSVETWIDGELAGGLYGVGIGRMFFGESMFARRTDASKVALAALVALCRAHGIPLIDCQQNTQHLGSLGGRELSRTAFERHLSEVLPLQGPKEWTYDSRWWALLGL